MYFVELHDIFHQKIPLLISYFCICKGKHKRIKISERKQEFGLKRKECQSGCLLYIEDLDPFQIS